MLKKIWVNNNEDKERCFTIRRAVFCEEQGIAPELDFDDMDDTAQHILITENDTPVATGRCVLLDNGYYLGRIAVVKQHRGKKYGCMVVNELCDYVFNVLNAQNCYLHAQLYAKHFYEQLGFKAYGDTFTEAGIEHISMVREA